MTPSFLESSRALWDGHARRDPLWAILSDPAKRGGKWDLPRFFQTGVGEIALRLYQVRARGVAIPSGAALDFGCGVGRLTQALAPYFERVVGVDVSPEMVALAHRMNRRPDRVSYLVNTAPHLAVFPDGHFTFVVSNIVLQHIQPELSLTYLQEFLRILGPDGVLIFQLPSHERGEGDAPPPPAVTPMPDEAYAARLDVRGVPAGPLAPASAVALDIEVTNDSPFEWARDTFGEIRVGNHWLDASGRMVLRDDGRAALPDTVASGETVVARLGITLPTAAGAWICEIDLAHEAVTWFADRGSPTARFAVMAGSGAGMAAPAGALARLEAHPDGGSEASTRDACDASPPAVGDLSAEDPGEFPMFGVPTGEVRVAIAQGGGEIFHVEDDRSCGDAWVSYRYFVRRRP